MKKYGKRYGNSRVIWTKEDMDRRDLEIEILKQDNCTESEAIKHLEEGTVIYESTDDYIEHLKESVFNNEESFKEEYGSEEEIINCFKINKNHFGNPLIEYNGKKYIIIYYL